MPRGRQRLWRASSMCLSDDAQMLASKYVVEVSVGFGVTLALLAPVCPHAPLCRSTRAAPLATPSPPRISPPPLQLPSQTEKMPLGCAWPRATQGEVTPWVGLWGVTHESMHRCIVALGAAGSPERADLFASHGPSDGDCLRAGGGVCTGAYYPPPPCLLVPCMGGDRLTAAAQAR